MYVAFNSEKKENAYETKCLTDIYRTSVDASKIVDRRYFTTILWTNLVAILYTALKSNLWNLFLALLGSFFYGVYI